ncbi:hypothetical protein H5410_000833 [Solanum commersonii]|uniref:Uncharacterized protein n=1 Tax=Solanum commersonii TaxID=4109 RepID=A0A9J6AXC7_SOLCO|nr:hypothetical protein H5410_000833 [Solanum commersonii]
MAPKAKNVAISKRSRKRKPKYIGDKFVRETMLDLGLRFIFDHPGDCNLSLVRELRIGSLKLSIKLFRSEVAFLLWGFDHPVSEGPGIEEEAVDLTIAFHPNLTGKLVDVTRTKALDTSHGSILSAQERQACDDSVMARMFGMAELQLCVGGR